MAVPIVEQSPQRWERALARAISDGLDVLVCAATGEAFVESGSRPGTLYAVSAEGCSCQAGAHDQICKHRAAYLAQLGELALPALASCMWCYGTGRVQNEYHERFDRCETCGGSGVRPDRRLHDAPAVEIVATAA
jgi:hypothetical protein